MELLFDFGIPRTLLDFASIDFLDFSGSISSF